MQKYHIMESKPRYYTAGMADFENIRSRNCIYVDKTDLIYRLVNESQYVFLSRPRRFGKSLLCNTLKSYFEGKKELFEGLAIAELERDWKRYPVFKFDISACKNQSNIEGIIDELILQLSRFEERYGRNDMENTIGKRFKGILERAHRQTGLPCVVIIDEYDSVLLEHLYDDRLPEVRRILQEFYQVLKIAESDLRFAFITGITKFSQLSIFSTINNLTNISMDSQYAAICGFTKEEVLDVFREDIEALALRYRCPFDEMVVMLRQQYDGYHFSDESPDVFNPFSITNVFKSKRLDYYWFSSGTPTFLFETMKRYNTQLLSLPQLAVTSSQFDVPTEGMESALPLLYQSGYLTIKDYDFCERVYTLDFPNAEVKVGFLESFMGSVMGVHNCDTQGWANRIYVGLLRNDFEKAMNALQSCFKSIPYLDHGNRILDSLANYEAYYEVITYIVFSMINCRTYTQVKNATGRTDCVVHLKDAIIVMEMKLDGTSDEALCQIDGKGYMIPYQTEGKRVVKVGISFSSETKTVEEWKVKE